MMTVALFFAEAKKNRRFRKNSQPRPGKTRACGEKGRGIRPFGKEKGSSAPASAFGLGFAPSAYAPTLRILLRACGSSRLSPPLRFCAAGMTFLRPPPRRGSFPSAAGLPASGRGKFPPVSAVFPQKTPFRPLRLPSAAHLPIPCPGMRLPPHAFGSSRLFQASVSAAFLLFSLPKPPFRP